MNPLIKWAGGKTRMAETIGDIFGPCEGLYVEPFMGSGAVFLWRAARGHIRQGAILTDVNPRLMNFHRVVRDRPEELLDRLAHFPVENTPTNYANMRVALNLVRTFEPAILDVPAAARFLWINKACFNGLYRENKRGEFNTPKGSYATVKLPYAEDVFGVSKLLQGVPLLTQGFGRTFDRPWGSGDQVYCDPPYVPASPTASFTAYSADGFGLNQQHALAALAHAVAARGGATVVVSNSDTPVSRGMYYDFEVRTLEARRSISRTGDRTPASELLAIARPIARP